jgi:hypothetical protein
MRARDADSSKSLERNPQSAIRSKDRCRKKMRGSREKYVQNFEETKLQKAKNREIPFYRENSAKSAKGQAKATKDKQNSRKIGPNRSEPSIEFRKDEECVEKAKDFQLSDLA